MISTVIPNKSEITSNEKFIMLSQVVFRTDIAESAYIAMRVTRNINAHYNTPP